MENVYELILTDDNIYGVYGVSLVSDPANEKEAIFLSKERDQFKLLSEEKKIVVCPVLVPNEKFLRKSIDNGNPGYAYFSKETIEKLEQNFFKNKYHHNSTIEHIEPIKDVYFFESWLVLDPKNDKSNVLGWELPEGTWMMSMKVDNIEVWDNYIKTGKIKGFSIDSIMDKVKVVLNEDKKINLKMNKKTISEIVQMSIQKVAMQSELNKYDIVGGLSVYAESLELGSIVTDAGGMPITDLEFVVDGMVYQTDAMGAIESIEKEEVETKPEGETSTDVDMEVDKDLETKPDMDGETKPEVENEKEVKPSEKELEMMDTIKNLEEKVLSLEEENGKLKAEMVIKEKELTNMSNEKPASVGIIDRPVINLSNEKPLSTIEAIQMIRNKNKNN